MLIVRTCAVDELSDAKEMLVQMHGRTIMGAVLSGFAGVAPRSAAPNLIELLSTLTQRFPAESRKWMTEVLFAVSAAHLASLLTFLKHTIIGRLRAMQGKHCCQGATDQGGVRVCGSPGFLLTSFGLLVVQIAISEASARRGSAVHTHSKGFGGD